MNKPIHTVRGGVAIAAALLALSLGACSKTDGTATSMGQKTDSAMAKTEQAASDVKGKAMDAGAAVGDKIDDATITASVNAGLAKDSELSATKIDVDTKAGTVVLNGPAPTPAAKARAEEIAKAVKGVSAVDNRLEVKTM